jgi:hypothetical protein
MLTCSRYDAQGRGRERLPLLNSHTGWCQLWFCVWQPRAAQLRACDAAQGLMQLPLNISQTTTGFIRGEKQSGN